MAQVKSIQMAEATPEQLRSYATHFLNLELKPDANDADVAAAIDRAQPGATMIFTMVADPVADLVEAPVGIGEAPFQPSIPIDHDAAKRATLRPEEVNRPLHGTLGKGDPRSIINIPMVETDDANVRQEVTVGVNGVAWQIARGQDVSLPQRVIEALDNAVADIVRHDDKGQVVVRQAKRISYQFIERPTPQSIARWHKETDALFCA